MLRPDRQSGKRPSYCRQLASKNGHEDSFLPSGHTAGSAEEALDCACRPPDLRSVGMFITAAPCSAPCWPRRRRARHECQVTRPDHWRRSFWQGSSYRWPLASLSYGPDTLAS